jgi:two-component system chemotaxis response regulator CheY
MPLDLNVRILLVDDMPAVRNLVRAMLEEAGFTKIEEAEDGETAWLMVQRSTSAARGPFGLIIADWNMPGMSGADLLRAVRSSNATRDMAFFIITAQGDDSHVREAIQAGVTDYVVKPFTGEQLLEKIQAYYLGA